MAKSSRQNPTPKQFSSYQYRQSQRPSPAAQMVRDRDMNVYRGAK